MPKMIIQEPHMLGSDVALERIKNLLSDLKERFSDQIKNVQEEWDAETATFSFDAMGFSVKGTLLVSTNQVELKGNLPLTALPFKGMVEKTVREQIQELLK